MKVVTLLVALLLTAASAHDVRVKSTVKGKKNVRTHHGRSSDLLGNFNHTWDDFEPELQNLCEGDYFELGNCDVYYEDLDSTEFAHVFEAKCGEDDVVVTFDMEDWEVAHAFRMHPYDPKWTELIALPHLEPAGCMYATLSDEDIDPEKLAAWHAAHMNGRRLVHPHQHDPRKAPYRGKSLFPIERPSSRATCSSYRVIRLGIKYDAQFCQQNGSSSGTATAAVHGLIDEMNKYFMAAPLCFKLESCHVDGFCSTGSDQILSQVIQPAIQFCGADGDLTDTFRNYMLQVGWPSGCDTVHLVFGGSPSNMQDAGGCAFGGGTLCTDYAVGGSNFETWYTEMDKVMLLAHEIGHTLSLDDHYPQDTTYIMGTGEGGVGFKPERMTKMQNYVAGVASGSCTYTTGAGSGPTGPTGPTGPAPTNAPVGSGCQDDSGWEDWWGDGCEWYEDNEDPGCDEYGWVMNDSNTTAAWDACCHCQ